MSAHLPPTVATTHRQQSDRGAGQAPVLNKEDERKHRTKSTEPPVDMNVSATKSNQRDRTDRGETTTGHSLAHFPVPSDDVRNTGTISGSSGNTSSLMETSKSKTTAGTSTTTVTAAITVTAVDKETTNLTAPDVDGHAAGGTSIFTLSFPDLGLTDP